MYFNEQEATNWKGKFTAFFKIFVIKNWEMEVKFHYDSFIFASTFSH